MRRTASIQRNFEWVCGVSIKKAKTGSWAGSLWGIWWPVCVRTRTGRRLAPIRRIGINPPLIPVQLIFTSSYWPCAYKICVNQLLQGPKHLFYFPLFFTTHWKFLDLQLPTVLKNLVCGARECRFSPNRKKRFLISYQLLCQRYTGEKLKDIGTYFGIGESGVSQACRRVKDKIRNDKKLERKIAKIEKKLNVSRMKTWPCCFA